MSAPRGLAGALLFVQVTSFVGCNDDPLEPSTCDVGGGAGALSVCSKPKQTAEYYVEQSIKYFDTFDVSVDPKRGPRYSELVARWEWPPWLKLTGYGKKIMEDTAAIAVLADPSTVPTRDCRAFEVQPFGRCYVVFDYDGKPCPIYEEFTFNDAGEITFIEAWTDAPDLLPMDREADRWAEGPAVTRLSTRIPGLGSASGRIDPAGEWISKAAVADADVADFAARADNFAQTWLAEYTSRDTDELYARGCGWN